VSMRQDWANADMQAPVRRDGEWRLMKSCNIKVGTWRAGGAESGAGQTICAHEPRTSEPGAEVE
jgi:hypothetical protein